MPIGDYVKANGWDAFRALEAELLKAYLESGAQVTVIDR